jgi:hypothetical protein
MVDILNSQHKQQKCVPSKKRKEDLCSAVGWRFSFLRPLRPSYTITYMILHIKTGYDDFILHLLLMLTVAADEVGEAAAGEAADGAVECKFGLLCEQESVCKSSVVAMSFLDICSECSEAAELDHSDGAFLNNFFSKNTATNSKEVQVSAEDNVRRRRRGQKPRPRVVIPSSASTCLTTSMLDL